MDPEHVRAVTAGGESLVVEFKSRATDRELVEAVACLANGSGGCVLVGVEDDGTVVGAEPRHGDHTDPGRVEAVIANRTDPALMTSVSVVDVDGRQVIAVEVGAAPSVVATSDGRYVRRALDVQGKAECVPMRPHEVLARAGSVGAQDLSRVVIEALRFEDLSGVEFDRLREYVGDGGDTPLRNLSDRDLLAALDLLGTDDRLTVGALLLFGQEAALARYLPNHEVSFQELDGLEVRANVHSRAPLLRAMHELSGAINARNPEEEIEIGLFRVGLPRFAGVAIRELVANALVHRDYTAIGSVEVEITQDALTISNPGGLPEGVTLDNLLTTPPRPRNPVLADAFKRAGLVERTGRGIDRVFFGQLSIGRPAPDYGRTNATSVVARLPAGPADRELASFIEESRRQGAAFSLEDLLTVHEVRRERRISTTRAAQLLQVGVDEARQVLNRLVERGLLEARGEGRGRTYHLAAAIYRRLGEPTQYVRTRGFDDLQQEQMVMTYVERHGSITRREAAELCQLDSNQARGLLQRLRRAGKLDLVGERRRAHYVLAHREA